MSDLFAQQKQSYDIHAAWLDKWLSMAGAMVAGSIALSYFGYAQLQLEKPTAFAASVGSAGTIAGLVTMLVSVFMYVSLLAEYRENAKRLNGTFTASEEFLVGSSGKFKYFAVAAYAGMLVFTAWHLYSVRDL